MGGIGSANNETQSIDSSNPESKDPTTEILSPLMRYKPNAISSTPHSLEKTLSLEFAKIRFVV